MPASSETSVEHTICCLVIDFAAHLCVKFQILMCWLNYFVYLQMPYLMFLKIETPIRILLQTVNTLMKCRPTWHFIRVCTVCQDNNSLKLILLSSECYDELFRCLIVLLVQSQQQVICQYIHFIHKYPGGTAHYNVI